MKVQVIMGIANIVLILNKTVKALLLKMFGPLIFFITELSRVRSEFETPWSRSKY